MRKRFQLLLFALVTGSLSEARNFTKTFTVDQAKEPGITAQLCQTDMMVVTLPGKVKSVGLSLPDNIEARRDENRVILMGKASKGRTPILIFMKETDDLYRLHLDGCSARGSTTMINIINRSKIIHLNDSMDVENNSMNVLLKKTITLPTPKSIQFKVIRRKGNMILQIRNSSPKNLALDGQNLKVFIDRRLTKINEPAIQIIKAGKNINFSFPLPKESIEKPILVEWLVQVPEMKAEFKLKGISE